MPEVLRLEPYGRRRSSVRYLAGIAAYTLVVVAMYPAFKGSTSLDDFIRSDATAAALFGVTGKISSSGGWLNGNLYAKFFPVVMLLMTVGYGAACIAGQDEEGLKYSARGKRCRGGPKGSRHVRAGSCNGVGRTGMRPRWALFRPEHHTRFGPVGVNGHRAAWSRSPLTACLV